ncbi:MAG TPA: M15 family metallopeptidase [Thermoanaerobaculia bacterium]
MVDIASLGISAESYYSREDGFNAPYYRPFSSALRTVYCRRTVAGKLLDVNQRLASYGVEVFVWDAFRPLACQQELWAYFIAEAKRTLQNATEEELVAYASRYCSNPSTFRREDPRTWPTHMTGGALDLTLRHLQTGELLFMGGIFDDPSPVSHTDFYEDEARLNPSASAVEALRNRRLLYWSMRASGFANYPLEWWHFDWGNQMWVLNRPAEPGAGLSAAKAFYGPADGLLP